MQLPERSRFPEYASSAGASQYPEARFWGDEWPTFSVERLATFTETDFRREFPSSYDRPHNYLAISGGGPNGAFGAGLLVGWTAAGTRPEFNMVTGVSTGALTAPFVFLGPDYDEVMKKLYTTTTTKDIITKRNPIAAAFSDSMADTTPLKELLAKYVDADMIAAIAREHKKGRRLYIGTVNLDAGRSMIWSIGAIAASDYPHKAELIHELMRASAAIPDFISHL